MKPIVRYLLAFLSLAFLTPGCGEQVTVFAAASLTDALKRIGAAYEQSGGDRIVFNFAGSGQLARQITAGAPADIFLSADQTRADDLAAQGLIDTQSRQTLLENKLVLVAGLDNTNLTGVFDLTNAFVAHIAVGDVKSVPCGFYTHSYLARLGIWSAVEARTVPCESVRSVLSVVESGNADAGFVYKTDAQISKRVKLVCEVPGSGGPKITYPIALVRGSPQPQAARKFFNYLESKDAADVFRKFGFIIPER